MALSNWDACALNEKGQPTNGVFNSPRTSVVIRIYKNWLYMNDKKAWEEEGGFIKDTVAQINSGCGEYKDVNFVVVRGPKYGVYFAVWTTVYTKIKSPDQKKNESHKDWCKRYDKWKEKNVHTYAMVGIGCSGHGSRKYLGVTKRDLAYLRKHVLTNDDKNEYYVPKEVSEIPLDKALRFNQGDGFFIRATGRGVSGVATKPGKAGEPWLSQMLMGPKRKKKKGKK